VLAAIVAPGHLRTIKTTALRTVEQTLEGMRLAGGAPFAAPSERTDRPYHD
jgi:hypothetical protein